MSKTSFGYRLPFALVLVACAACSPTVDLGGPLPSPPETPGGEGENPGQAPAPEAYAVAIGEATPLGALNRTRVSAIAAHDDVVFVVSDSGTFRSADAGSTWQEIVIADVVEKKDPVVSVAFFEGRLFALTWGGAVFASSDDGLTFPVTSRPRPVDGLSFPDGGSLRATHGMLFGIFEGKPHRFVGDAWKAIPTEEFDFFDEITTDGKLILAHSVPFSVVKRMPLEAEVPSWTEIEELSGWAYRLSWAGDAGYAWSQNGGLRRSTDGIVWTTIADPTALGDVGHIAQSVDKQQLVLTSSSGIYVSADGMAWRKDQNVSSGDLAVGSRVFVAGAGVHRSEGATFVPTSLNAGEALQVRGGARPEVRTAWGSLAWTGERWVDAPTPGPSVELADGTRYAYEGNEYWGEPSVSREDSSGWKKIAFAPGRLLGAVGKRLYATGRSWQGSSCGGKAPSGKANDVFVFSDDQGKSWNKAEGLKPTRLSCEYEPGYEDFASLSGNSSIALLLAAEPWNSVYIARGGESTWERTMDGLDPKVAATASLVSGETALLAFGTKLFKLEGSAWKPLAAAGLPDAARVTALAQVEGCVVAAVDAGAAASSGVYTSCDQAATFTVSAKVRAPSVLDYRKGTGQLVIGSRRLGVWSAPVTRR